ncbi:hypothetical protein PHAVU_003G093300 [Phaseolus vulgaris]|uniref:Uncharacterized protein n=1 Tax=Phaseolus vulgaris TaxID=3885 RepID=V7C9U7_PHAVU|nr:hypothetical protein PHAVU_003G093300g [Phaseolus vulgaris]ESW26128.1 hypothetical protein PHAVU_003G093300g [Phaseolus vulgaris]
MGKTKSESKKSLTFRVSPQTTNALPPHHEELRLAPVVTDFTETLYLLTTKNFFCPRVSNSHHPSLEFGYYYGFWEEEGSREDLDRRRRWDLGRWRSGQSV